MRGTPGASTARLAAPLGRPPRRLESDFCAAQQKPRGRSPGRGSGSREGSCPLHATRSRGGTRGRERMRLPVSANIALATAGATGGTAGLADAGRGLRARHDVDLDLRHLVDPQHRVVVEVALLHAPVLERDLRRTARPSRPKTMAPSIWAWIVVRVDGAAAVDGADDAMDADRPSCDRDLGHLRARSCRTSVDRDAARRGPRAGGVPSRPSRRRARARPGSAGGPPSSSAAELERVLAGRVRQLVDEALDDEGRMGVADRAPPQHGHAARGLCESTAMFGIA